jgi:hypothetical protein
MAQATSTSVAETWDAEESCSSISDAGIHTLASQLQGFQKAGSGFFHRIDQRKHFDLGTQGRESITFTRQQRYQQAFHDRTLTRSTPSVESSDLAQPSPSASEAVGRSLVMGRTLRGCIPYVKKAGV